MPTTGRYPLIQLEAIYLTQTGLVGGKPCRIRVEGLATFALTKEHQVDKALTGLPYLQVSDAMLGKPISLHAESDMPGAVYASIVAEGQAVLDGSKAELDLDISNSAYGTFSLDVVPDYPFVRHSAAQQGTSTKGVSFHFLTTTI